jgi:hypothetical protein
MADALDAKELRKLGPEERLKKLKELEEQRKKELKEAEGLIKESIVELEETVKRAPPPQTTQSRADVEGSDLEQQIAKEEPVQEQGKNITYAVNLYGELREMRDVANTYEGIMRAVDIYERIKSAETYQGNDASIKQIAQGSRRIMKELFGEYSANHEYR